MWAFSGLGTCVFGLFAVFYFYRKNFQKKIFPKFMSGHMFLKNVTMCYLNQGNHHTLAWTELFKRVHFSKNVVRFAKSCDFQLYLAPDSHRAISAAMRSLERHRSTHKRSFVQKTRFSSPFVCGTTPHATKPKVSTRTNWMCATNHISAHVQTRHTHSDLETLLRTFCNHSSL